MGEGFDYDYHDVDEGEPEPDRYLEDAVRQIEEIISTQKVVTERELKVRLEDKFFPWVTGHALKTMVENTGTVVSQGLAGRRGRIETKIFYSLPDFAYDEIVGEMREKRNVSREVNAMLTGHAPATYYAEDLFERAFLSLGFEIIERNASEYKGRKAIGIEGKEPPNLDFILERDNITYGADVKNWIRFESNTRTKVMSKVEIAKQLGIVPFIIARYVDKDTMYKGVILNGGICYIFKTLIFSPDFDSLALKASQVLGYPTIALDRLPWYKLKYLDSLHKLVIKKKKR
ncbi:hypothetical protein MUP77_08390 [Candidatus Bathyarchaeota archaeon]|nr:hypothetical protein [Candidatus Bathyarchaeota archaeon]